MPQRLSLRRQDCGELEPIDVFDRKAIALAKNGLGGGVHMRDSCFPVEQQRGAWHGIQDCGAEMVRDPDHLLARPAWIDDRAVSLVDAYAFNHAAGLVPLSSTRSIGSASVQRAVSDRK